MLRGSRSQHSHSSRSLPWLKRSSCRSGSCTRAAQLGVYVTTVGSEAPGFKQAEAGRHRVLHKLELFFRRICLCSDLSPPPSPPFRPFIRLPTSRATTESDWNPVISKMAQAGIAIQHSHGIHHLAACNRSTSMLIRFKGRRVVVT